MASSRQSRLQQETLGFQGTPIYGVGLGFRREIAEETLSSEGIIDWLEFTPENVMGVSGSLGDALVRAKEKFPLISHGVSLSIGSVDPLNERYLASLETLFSWAEPAWFSDHLSFSSVDGHYFHDLLPLPRLPETVEHVAQRVALLKARFNRPFLLENASYYMTYSDEAMTDAEFLAAVVTEADCGMLLDVNNVYVNSMNQGFDPKDYLEALPLERVVQIHVAGHHHCPEGIVNTHGSAVCEDVWALLERTLERCRPSGVMIERDSSIPPFEELVPELRRLRDIWNKTQDKPCLSSEVFEREAVVLS